MDFGHELAVTVTMQRVEGKGVPKDVFSEMVKDAEQSFFGYSAAVQIG
jgi:hypothetical protein